MWVLKVFTVSWSAALRRTLNTRFLSEVRIAFFAPFVIAICGGYYIVRWGGWQYVEPERYLYIYAGEKLYSFIINGSIQDMIARLTGKIVDVRVMHIVIDVHGVGYLVAVTHGSGYALGSEASVYTYLAVRENALDLYGFSTQDELVMFEQLIKLPKIGPKTALQILSQADLETLKKAVRTDDPVYLTKMSGIGKKSAEKIVAGLKDVLELADVPGEHSPQHQGDSDVMDALMTLGYSQRDALQAMQKIPADITDTNARIKHALKYISS